MVSIRPPHGLDRGLLRNRAPPADAEVRLDGLAVPGKTPMKIENVDGRIPHRIRVSLRGYDVWEQDVRFGDNSSQVLVQMQLLPSAGTLELSSSPEPLPSSIENRIRPPKRADRSISLMRGGVTSPTQKRNANRPASVPLGVSKTMSYEPGAGRVTDETAIGSWKRSRYGFSTIGNAV